MFLLKRARVVQSSGTNSQIYPILSPPVCCRVPRYRPHESNIIMDKIGDLLKNDFIEKRKGPWESQIVLTAKPHQDHIQKNEDFVWSMCVSYHGLNIVTLPFEYPIP